MLILLLSSNKHLLLCALFSFDQDFTGLLAVVDFACTWDAIKKCGSDPDKINPLVYNILW